MSPQDLLQLRDIHPPAEPGFWPPAPGWWLLACTGLALLAWTSVVLGRRLRRRRLQRRVLTELSTLGDGGDPTGAAAGISALLKRVALARFPPREVAALAGEDWLAFLDRTGGNGRFRSGPGRPLADAPYAPPRPLDLTPLLELARDWVRKNL